VSRVLADEAARESVIRTPGLVAFWTFGEEAGQPRLSTGTRQPHPLREVSGPIARVENGPYSGYSAELKQYFSIPYAETGDLNICGPEAQVSMFAVVPRTHQGVRVPKPAVIGWRKSLLPFNNTVPPWHPCALSGE
jgi:hypothetical protein